MSGLGSSVGQNSEDTSAARFPIRFNTKTYPTWQQASDACAALQSKAKSGSVWGRVSKVEKGGAEFELHCQKCGTQCQLMNPAKWHKDHTEEACSKRAKKAPGFKRQAASSSMVQFTASAQQKEAFIDGLVKAMATSCISFTFMENSYLKEAARALGVELPGRRALAGPILDRVFEESQCFTKESIGNMDYPCGASDGWRKKYCEGGASLMNFTVMGNEGALLYDMRDCSDIRKNESGIAKLLSQTGAEIMGGVQHSAGFAGWVIDNTRSNHAAIRSLQETQPEWVNVGCIAHGTALAMKDFCKFSRSQGRHSTEWGVQWLTSINKDANMLANFVHDSSAAKALLRSLQKEVYGAPRAITVSVPTRFATNFLVMQSIQRSKAALLQACADDEWSDLGGKCKEAQAVLERADFWRLLSLAISFLQPFSDFIHQIEADRPALARTYEGLMTLDGHVKSSMKHWAKDELTQSSCSAALRTWERRLDNQHGKLVVPLLSPAHTAAYLLDPLFCVVRGGVANVPLVPSDREEAAQQLIERVGGPAASQQFNTLIAEGWTGAPFRSMAACAQQHETAQAVGNRQRPHVASIAQRKGVWRRYGVEAHGELAKVALRLLSMHATSAASERNWALWGRVYGASRNALSMERAKKLITFCFNSRAERARVDDFGLLLRVMENTADDEHVLASEDGD
jgi:hypothetical protein